MTGFSFGPLSLRVALFLLDHDEITDTLLGEVDKAFPNLSFRDFHGAVVLVRSNGKGWVNGPDGKPITDLRDHLIQSIRVLS